jgi:hypothetical protein
MAGTKPDAGNYKCAYCPNTFDIVDLPEEFDLMTEEELAEIRAGDHEYYKMMCDSCYTLLGMAQAGGISDAVH